MQILKNAMNVFNLLLYLLQFAYLFLSACTIASTENRAINRGCSYTYLLHIQHVPEHYELDTYKHTQQKHYNRDWQLGHKSCTDVKQIKMLQKWHDSMKKYALSDLCVIKGHPMQWLH